MPHMVSSEGNGRADVWSAEASLGCEDVEAPADEDGGMDDDDDDDDDEDDVAELLATSMDAVAIDNRERTRSSGYVVPAIEGKKCIKQNQNARSCGQSQIGRTNRQK